MYPEPKRQVYVRFELPTERLKYTKDGKEIEGPMSIGRIFTASMSEKANLRKFIESWFGKRFPSDQAAADFDLQLLLGHKCLLNVTHTEKNQKTYANLVTATPIPKGMPAEHKQHNASLYFSLESPSDEAYAALPDWLRKKIDERLSEPKAAAAPAPLPGAVGNETFEEDDSIPF